MFIIPRRNDAGIDFFGLENAFVLSAKLFSPHTHTPGLRALLKDFLSAANVTCQTFNGVQAKRACGAGLLRQPPSSTAGDVS
jgi:hypothetical protein